MTIDDVKVGMIVVCEEKHEETDVLCWASYMDDYIGQKMVVTDICGDDGTVLCYLCDGSYGSAWYYPEWLEPYETNYIHHPNYDPDGNETYECESCGVVWWFEEGGPEDNELFFCPKCGRKVKGVIEE